MFGYFLPPGVTRDCRIYNWGGLGCELRNQVYRPKRRPFVEWWCHGTGGTRICGNSHRRIAQRMLIWSVTQTIQKRGEETNMLKHLVNEVILGRVDNSSIKLR